MSKKFNEKLLLWGLGVIQPATPGEVVSFLGLVYPQVDQWPSPTTLDSIFANWLEDALVVRLNKKHQLFALTSRANVRLDVKLRRQRDKARITLLRSIYDATLLSSEVVDQNLDGDSPSSEVSSTSQECSRPVNSGPEPSRQESTRHRARIYWPRVSEQLEFSVGSDFHASDIPSYRFRYCSFPNLKSIQEASSEPPLERDMTISQLALAIGVSPRLLTSFTHKKDNHYRRFSIGKKGGGEREIASPRYFLKTIQYWIKSYLFGYLKIHNACHAYLPSRSIITNAEQHLGRAFVANIDIEDFFGSITRNLVYKTLVRNDIGEQLARTVANLITLDDKLPQGAPTSPDLSNAYLYEFDEFIAQLSEKSGVVYTRYADDLTISGDSRGSIQDVLDACGAQLKKYELRINDKKTRIASSASSQRVTGIAVNEKLQPPRSYLRNVRAMFHNAAKNPEQHIEQIDKLQGYISYLSAFPELKDSPHLVRYRKTLRRVITSRQALGNN